ncbi:MAG: 4-hydroxy-tetrahydrodipicolinate synthase [Thaumarchaeota archaeon]|nr:4-hydroxy-tetrahydrodipicolinate synthase [Nitrososphaerota archaeon]
MVRFSGCYTATITPFNAGQAVDWNCLRSLVEFQRSQGVSGIVPAGTTGESPTLTWEEHNKVIEAVFFAGGSKLETIAGTGSNSTDEALEATHHVAELGLRTVLLVDPYYNGPSSLEIRREYYEPIATAFPDVQIIPYVIPGRTGTQLLPQDLGILATNYQNVSAVKEATGSLDNARLTRNYCGQDFSILSGDDDKTLALMSDQSVRSSGVISVVSNIAPRAVQGLVQSALTGDWREAQRLATALQPLFALVTLKTEESTKYGPVGVKARNPLPIKTTMQVLGMTTGHCRSPLGKVTRNALNVILDALRTVWSTDPEILEPIESAFGVSIPERLQTPRNWEGLAYAGY